MLCTMTDQLACFMASYYKVFNLRLSTTPMHGMLFTMSDLVECIRDCSMLYVLQSAQLSPVYYPNAWYVVQNVRLNGMHQGLFHAICTRKCSIITCLLPQCMVCCVYNVRLNGMHQGLFHTICTTKCSIFACLLSHRMVCCVQWQTTCVTPFLPISLATQATFHSTH